MLKIILLLLSLPPSSPGAHPRRAGAAPAASPEGTAPPEGNRPLRDAAEAAPSLCRCPALRPGIGQKPSTKSNLWSVGLFACGWSCRFGHGGRPWWREFAVGLGARGAGRSRRMRKTSCKGDEWHLFQWVTKLIIINILRLVVRADAAPITRRAFDGIVGN